MECPIIYAPPKANAPMEDLSYTVANRTTFKHRSKHGRTDKQICKDRRKNKQRKTHRK